MASADAGPVAFSPTPSPDALSPRGDLSIASSDPGQTWPLPAHRSRALIDDSCPHPYQCPACSKGFTLAESLRIHSLVHGASAEDNTTTNPSSTSPDDQGVMFRWSTSDATRDNLFVTHRRSAPDLSWVVTATSPSRPRRDTLSSLNVSPSRRSWDLSSDTRSATIRVLQERPLSRRSPDATRGRPSSREKGGTSSRTSLADKSQGSDVGGSGGEQRALKPLGDNTETLQDQSPSKSRLSSQCSTFPGTKTASGLRSERRLKTNVGVSDAIAAWESMAGGASVSNTSTAQEKRATAAASHGSRNTPAKLGKKKSSSKVDVIADNSGSVVQPAPATAAANSEKEGSPPRRQLPVAPTLAVRSEDQQMHPDPSGGLDQSPSKSKRDPRNRVATGPGGTGRHLPSPPRTRSRMFQTVTGSPSRRQTAPAALDDMTQTWPRRGGDGTTNSNNSSSGDRTSATETTDEEDDAARLRRDFRAWLAWREEDAARARAAADARAKNPAALLGADPTQFRLDGNGGVVRRQRHVPEREQLATQGIVWMQEPTYTPRA